MGSKARNYTEKTLKRLFALSGNECAFPACTRKLVNQKNALDSNICHIEAASPGGERYNPDMSDSERADYDNLILLCPQHHDETNNVEIYTVKVLKEMKKNHESKCLYARINNNPSMLKNTINAIANINLEEYSKDEILNAFNPKEKIEYNSIKKNVSLIEEYKIYHTLIDSIYNELEKQGSIKKERLLSNIKQIYIKIKGGYILNSENSLTIIRENSDNIIKDVYDELYSKLSDSNFFDEDIILGINLIMVDSFIRCKILEEPQRNDN